MRSQIDGFERKHEVDVVGCSVKRRWRDRQAIAIADLPKWKFRSGEVFFPF